MAIDHVSQLYIKPDHVVFNLVPLAFGAFIERCYQELGCPSVGCISAWAIYGDLMHLIRQCEGIPMVLNAIEGHNIPDDELPLMPGLQDLHEIDGYMGGVAYGLGLRKSPRSLTNCVHQTDFKFCVRN